MIEVSPFEHFPELSTKRLQLRQLMMDDAPDVFKIYGDPKVMRHSLEPPFATITNARIHIRFFSDEYAYRRLIWWGMYHRRDEAVIGLLGLWHIDLTAHIAELGFDTASRYWRKGYTHEAIVAVLRFGFDNLHLQRVYAKTVLENLPSMRLLEKVGFVEQGVVPPNTPRNELRVPVRYFELNKEDFDAKRP